MNNIYTTAKKCQDYIEHNISFSRNKIRAGRIVFTDYDIVGNIEQLEKLLKDLHSTIKVKYPSIATSLKESMDLYDNDRIVHISAITAIVNCICAIVWNLNLFVDLVYGYSNNVSFYLHIACAVIWDICAIYLIVRYRKYKKQQKDKM